MAKLILRIFHFCEPSDDADKHFALVCNMWFEVFVSTRWQTVRDPRRLLGAYGFYGSARKRRYNEIYSQHVQFLDFDEQHLGSSALDNFFDTLRFIEHIPILPNVTSLRFANVRHAQRFGQISLWMNHRITKFVIEDDFQASSNRLLFSESSYHRLLLRIPIHMPYLRQLELGLQFNLGFSSYQPVVDSLKDLRIIRLPALGTIPNFSPISSAHLESLAVGVKREIVDRALHFTGYGYVDTPILLIPDCFPNLSTFEVYCTHLEAIRFFRSIHSTRLRNIAISVPAGRSVQDFDLPSRGEIRVLFSAIAHAAPSAQKVSLQLLVDKSGAQIFGLVKGKPDIVDMVHVDDLIPLSACVEITSFVLDHVYPASMNSEDVVRLTAAWPKLRELAICPGPLLPLGRYPFGMKHPDWTVLPLFARYNPHISVVRLVIMSPPLVHFSGLSDSFRKLLLSSFDPGPYVQTDNMDTRIFRPGINGFRELTTVYHCTFVEGA
ncbi:hypothetical protein VNI00_016128 [Paramarasmius palmivorus]|uniref:F-box domain-containing protein n=1 Tax=Paramarasmius palmivorus TaxID=297713 RepID=A0AAW0BG22_9AGAR